MVFTTSRAVISASSHNICVKFTQRKTILCYQITILLALLMIDRSSSGSAYYNIYEKQNFCKLSDSTATKSE
jgi:hypothetical protein